MSDYAGNIDGGATGAEALGKMWGKLFTPGSAIVSNSASYQVTQRAAGTNMSVDIAPGAGLSGLADYSIIVWSSATINNTVNAADPTNPRNDIVVRYVDLTAYGPTNNVGATKFKIVSGTPAGSPSDPSDSAIQSAVGVGNPWNKLARITLPANATSVVNGYITDLRTPIAYAGRLYGGSSNTSGHTVPNVADDTVALLNATQTFTGKTVDGGNNTFTNVPSSTNRRNNGANVNETAAKIQTGWAATQPGNSASATIAVTFPIAFTNPPIVTATFGGDTTGVTSTLGGGGGNVKQGVAEAFGISTTGFSLVILSRDGSSWATNNTVYAQWIAIGA